MSRWPVAAALAAAAGLACLAAAPAYDWRLPRGVSPPPVPAGNPMSAAKVELGRRLFYDADLSVDGTLSCASCHEQNHGFTDGNATHSGVKGAPGRRNVMGLANVAYLAPLTWADPGQRTLEAQVGVPVAGEHPVEMGMHGQEAEIVRRLAADGCYRSMFATAFPERKGEISFASAADAIAAFERTLLAWNSPYDRFQRGDRRALTVDARRGAAVFQARGCASCHAGPNFTDGRFHAVEDPRGEDQGLAEKTGDPADRGRFRTPGLRNVALTRPYFHDGSARTLRVAIFMHSRAAEAVTQDDATDIESFLTSLTDTRLATDARYALPRRLCGRARSG
jgi:cytochrome c peroxidase